MKLVKYFSKQDLNYYKRGQVKFGTLEGYRLTEKKVSDESRFSDDQEGLWLRRYKVEGGTLRAAKMGTSHFQNVTFTNCETDFSDVIRCNAWAFCASMGPYSKSHHKDMRFGKQIGDVKYSGNKSLTNYVEIDLVLFLHAIQQLCQEKIIQKEWNHWITDWDEVVYRDVDPIQISGDSYDFDLELSTEEERIKTRFEKRTIFSVEKEFRILIFPNWSNLESGAKELLLSSDLIRSSFLKFGSF